MYYYTLGELKKKLNAIPEEKNDLKVFFCNTASGVYELVDGGGVLDVSNGTEDGDELPGEFVVLYSR